MCDVSAHLHVMNEVVCVCTFESFSVYMHV